MTSQRITASPRSSRPSAARTILHGCLLMLFGTFQLAQASTWVVNNTGDSASGTPAHCPSASACTLRDAIAAAGANDTIAFNVGANKTIKLTSNTTLTLAASVTVDGSGSTGLKIDGNHAVTVVLVNAATTVAISHLSIVNGQGSIVPVSQPLGGGIYNNGTLTLTDVTVSGNSAYGGGGILNNGTLTVSACTIQGNAASVYGGGIYHAAPLPLLVTGSTISGNSSATRGGGIYNTGFLTVANSSIVGNSAVLFGGGIDNEDPLTLANVTFSGNSATPGDGADINSGLQFTSNNSIFADGCRLVAPILGGNNLDAGTSCGLPAPSSNALLNLGTLQNNGGTTLTMLPGYGSAAIDAGLNTICGTAPVSAVDQRGVARPSGAACDIGAVEVKRCYVKSDAVGANNGTSWSDAYTDLQSALSGCEEVQVARGVYKPTATSDRTIAFRIPPHLRVSGGYAGIGTWRDPFSYLTVLSGDIDGNDTGSNGVDADASKIVGANSYHVLVMDGTTAAGPITADTILDGFTITGGKADGASPNDSGGGLVCNGSGGAGHACNATLSNLHFAGNYAAYVGGALYNDGSGGGSVSPAIVDTTFSGNSASNGGAVYQYLGNSSNTSFANVTFAGNSVPGYGGAIYNYQVTGSAAITMVNVTYSGNSANAGGAAITDYNCGGPILTSALTNMILWGDSPGEVFFVCDTPTFKNSVIAGSGGSGSWHAGFGTNGGGNLDLDPLLGPLQDNGGAAPTLKPGSASPVIDAGLDSACNTAPISALDQRGIVRPVGAHCDIGAIEATSLSMYVGDGSAVATYGGTIHYTVTLSNNSQTDSVSGIRIGSSGTAALDAVATSFCRFGNCAAQTAGPLDDKLTLAPGSLQTWLVNVPVLKMAQDATATMTIHSNAASAVGDTDILEIFRGTFDPP